MKSFEIIPDVLWEKILVKKFRKRSNRISSIIAKVFVLKNAEYINNVVRTITVLSCLCIASHDCCRSSYVSTNHEKLN